VISRRAARFRYTLLALRIDTRKLHSDPEPLPDCDVLIVESTYGNRRHETKPVLDQIREEFKRVIHK
jgi:Cft2 family RNA processing exonuclease